MNISFAWLIQLARCDQSYTCAVAANGACCSIPEFVLAYTMERPPYDNMQPIRLCYWGMASKMQRLLVECTYPAYTVICRRPRARPPSF